MATSSTCEERLQFQLQPLTLVLDHPLQSLSSAKQAGVNLGNFYARLKCKHRDHPKVKLDPVRFAGANCKIRADGKLEVFFEMHHFLSFIVTFKMGGDSDTAQFAKETLQLEVLLLQMQGTEEKARKTLYDVPLDLREILRGARQREQGTYSFTLSEQRRHFLTLSYLVTPASMPPPAFKFTAPQKRSTEHLANATMDTAGADEEEMSTVFHASAGKGLVELLSPTSCRPGEEIQAASKALDAVRSANPATASEQMATLGTVYTNHPPEAHRTVSLPSLPLAIAFELLFINNAPLQAKMHEARKNEQVVEFPWEFISNGATKKGQFVANLGTVGRKKLDETSYLVAVTPSDSNAGPNAGLSEFGPGDMPSAHLLLGANGLGGNAASSEVEFFKLSVLRSEQFSGARMQLLVRLRGNGRGSIATFIGYTHATSSSLSVDMMMKPLNRFATKLVVCAETALLALAQPAATAASNGGGSAGQTAEKAPSLSYDLWFRLCDEVGVNAKLVAHYLTMLWEKRSSSPPRDGIAKLTDTAQKSKALHDFRNKRLVSLDQALCRYPRDAAVVSLACQHIKFLVASWSADAVVELYEPIVGSLADALNAQQPAPLAQEYRPLCQALVTAQARARQRVFMDLDAAIQPLEKLSEARIIADAGFACHALENILHRNPALHRYTFAEVSLLTKVAGLHLTDASVAQGVLRIVTVADDRDPFRRHAHPAFHVVVTEMLKFQPQLGAQFQGLLQDIRGMSEASAGVFQRRYGTFITESPFAEYNVYSLNTDRATTLFITPTFVCVDGDVIERRAIRKVELFRRVIKPAVRLEVFEESSAASPSSSPSASTPATTPDAKRNGPPVRHVSFSLWSRASFLESMGATGAEATFGGTPAPSSTPPSNSFPGTDGASLAPSLLSQHA